jgi:hypothetical protein
MVKKMTKFRLKKYTGFLLLTLIMTMTFLTITQVTDNQFQGKNWEVIDNSTSLQSSNTWSAPTQVGSLLTATNAYDIKVQGDLAYVASSTGGLRIINISDPANPHEIGQIAHGGGSGRGVFVEGHLAYLADDDQGLQIIDVSDPYHPVERGVYNSGSGYAYDVYVDGSYAYLADYWDGLRILDITDPDHPVHLARMDPGGGWTEAVQVVNGIAYTADFGEGLEIIDVTNPQAPVFLDRFDEESGNEQTMDVQVVGGIAYTANQLFGIKIFNVTNPRDIVKLTEMTSATFTRAIYAEENRLYEVQGNSFVVWNVTDPANPSYIGQIALGNGYSAQVLGNYAYIADGPAGIKILQGFESSLPEWQTLAEVGSWDDGSGNGWAVQVEGSVAYIADQADGVEIIDISDPFNPTEINTFSTGGGVRDIFVEGKLVYAADVTFGFRIINVTDPAHPSLVTTFYDGSGAEGVFVAGGLAYVAAGSLGLEILNVTNPSSLSKVGAYGDAVNSSADVEVVGGLAYVADYSHGLEIINVSDPSAPWKVGSYDPGGDAWRVDVVGTTAFVGYYSGGLKIVDCSNPASPVKVSDYGDGTNYTIGVHVVGGLAFIANRYDGIEVFNITNLRAPIRIGSLDISGNEPYGVQAVGNLLYVADRQLGLRIIEGLAPSVDSPPDAIHALGASSRVIEWTLRDDLAGGYYRVLINGSKHVSWASWVNDGPVSVPVNTTRGVGDWEYCIEYNDSVGIFGDPDYVIITLENTPPSANIPGDASYAANFSATYDQWILTDNYAGGEYSVLLNGSMHVNKVSWTSGENLSVPVEVNKALGTWNYTLLYNDSAGVMGTPDTVFITIYDNLTPTVNSPQDTGYPANASAVTYNLWILSDNVLGGNYRILRNGGLYVNWQPWTSGANLSVPIDTDGGFGVWNYTIQYYDSVGLWGTQDTVLVTIYDNQTPTSSKPADALYGKNLTRFYTQWVLTDNLLGGYYQVLINDTEHVGWTSWTSGANLTVPVDTNRGGGFWNYTLLYNDSVGIWGAPDTVMIYIDDMKPWSSNPAGDTVDYGDLKIISWTLYDDIAGGYCRVLLNGTEFEPWTPWIDLSPVIIQADTNRANGDWNYTIEYYDAGGLYGTPHTVIITIINAPEGGIPGFELAFGILALLAVAAASRHKKRN